MYETTSNLGLALHKGYIGEIVITPILLSSLIHKAYTGEELNKWTMYFCGKPDAELKKFFGYNW